MRNLSTWQFVAGLALTVALGGLWGCAQNVDDIDRTQPDKIDKSIFETDDEWYMQQTIVDTTMEGGALFPALESNLKRIRWTVTQNYLYAHSSVELAEGLNEGFDEEEARRTGVVAAFPITDQFDVQRQYNSSTGEPTNVIVENRSDRPWHQRDYMRVNWSQNLVDGFQNFQGMIRRMSPVQDYRNQEEQEIRANRARVTEDFVDTVTDYHFDADPMLCWDAYGLDAAWSCEGGRTSVRTSMVKVPEEETYEPMNYVDAAHLNQGDGDASEPLITTEVFDSDLGYLVEVECTDEVKNWMLQDSGLDYEDRCEPARFDFHQRFGYFRTERVDWDRYIGTSEDQRRYYVNRWNVWQTMVDEDGRTIPAEDRTPKPITFYKNLEYPEFMYDAAATVAEEWDQAFRGAVKVAMDIDDAELDAILDEEYGHNEMFRIVENSCHPGPLVNWFDEHGDSHPDDRMHVAGIFEDFAGTTNTDGEIMENALWDLPHDTRRSMCAHLEHATEVRPVEEQRFTWERVGDVRYSFFNWVEEATRMWAGYGPSAADPKTGEIIRANANFAGQGVRQNATYAADVIQYFNNELSTHDILHGVQIRDDLFNNDHDEERFGLEPEAQRELTVRAGADPDQVSETNFEELPAYEDLDPFIKRHGLERVQREADIAAAEGSLNASADERMIAFLEHPEVKNIMLGDVETSMAVRAMARERHGAQFDDEQFHQAYLDFHSPRMFHDRKDQFERMLSERNIMTQEDMARATETLVTYEGVADHFAGQPREDIKEYFLNELFIGTQLHEVGHAVGLRHNFSGHADALNYHDEFWAIEQAIVEGEITREEANSLDADQAEQILGHDDFDYVSQPEFKLSTVMDYTADLTGRFAGLGKYDQAAINFAYGEVVEQWTDDVTLPNAFDTYSMLTDYNALPFLMAGNQMGTGDAETFAEGVEAIKEGREYVSIDDAMAQRRADIRDNTDRWMTYSFGDDHEPNLDRSVGYEFCSDEFRGRILDCAAWVYGANQQEMVNHAFDTWRAFQTFWRHRRHNIDRDYGNLNRYASRLIRTFQTTQEPFRYFSIYRWFDLGDYTEDLQAASIDGFNFYNEVLAMPQPGRHCRYDESSSSVDPNWFYDLENTYVPADYHINEGNCSDYIDIPRGVGQEYNYKFTDEYEYRIDRVGSYIDKIIASQMLFDISAEFAQSAFFTDFRATNISYWTVFKDEMLEMMGGKLLGDYQNFGAMVNGGDIDFPKPVDPDMLGRTAEDDDDAPRVFTPQSVNHELNMLAGGLIYSSTWEDRAPDFTHYVKVATTEQERQEFGAGTDTVEFVHPVTQQVYTAANIDDNAIGARMIERANKLGERYEDLEALIEETDADGSASQSEIAQMEELLSRYEEQLQDMVAKMDMARFAIDATHSLR